MLQEEDSMFVHGYMSNAGYEDVRETMAQSLNQRFGTSFDQDNILMTVGAASGLNVILKTLLNPGDEVIVFAPYFLEYGNYVRNYDGKLVVISPQYGGFPAESGGVPREDHGGDQGGDHQYPQQSHRRGVSGGDPGADGRDPAGEGRRVRDGYRAALGRAVPGAGL